MLVVTGLGITVIIGLLAYGLVFANRPFKQRLAYSVLMAALTPVILFVLMGIIVGLTFDK